MLKALGELIAFIAMVLVLFFVLKYRDIEQHGLKPFYEKSQVWVHDMWYGR